MTDATRQIASPAYPPSIAGLLIVVAVCLGGGGSPAPLWEALVEAAALLAIGVAVAQGIRPLGIWREDPALAGFAMAVLALPIAQLIPLPPVLWQSLPGREAAQASFAAAGIAGQWRPWSLTPDTTVAAWLACLPAAAILILVTPLPTVRRVWLLGWLALVGLAASLLGVVQFIRGPARALSLYDEVHLGWAIGFFANRNAQADLVAIALVAGLLLAARHRERLTPATRWALAMAGLVMVAGGVVTGSRMGLLVLGVPVLLAVVMLGRRAPLLAAAFALAGGLLLVGGTALDRVAARAHDPGNRVEIWGDSLFVARQVAPVGGGMGSFQPLYAAAERLDHVQPTIANRAHNDYLELAIEGGLPALAILAWGIALVARRAAAGWRDGDPDRRTLARFAALITVILLVHSTVDYPLRNLTLLTVAALAVGGVARDPAEPREDKKGSLDLAYA